MSGLRALTAHLDTAAADAGATGRWVDHQQQHDLPGVVDTPITHDDPLRMNEVLMKTTPKRRRGADFAIDGGMSI